MSRLYNPPPDWPTPPAGWTPPPGWQPDPTWGPPPEGWEVWVQPPRPWYRKKRFAPLWLLLALFLFGSLVEPEEAGQAAPADSAPVVRHTSEPESAGEGAAEVDQASQDEALRQAEAARLAAEQDAARLAAEVEAARRAEAARLATEQEAARLAAEQEQARAAEAVRQAEATRQAEAARSAREQNAASAATSQSSSSVYYKNCSAARAAGAAPVQRGEPGYASHLDRDGDGVGCE